MVLIVTIRDVAREAKVSIGTVSRAFNDYQDINAITKKHIFETARRLGYTPNASAKSLSSKTPSNMGLIVSGFLDSDVRNGFVLSLLKGTYRYAFEHNLEVSLYTLDADKQRSKSYEQFCAEHSIFGAVISGVAINEPYFEQLVKTGIPCVLVDVYLSGNGLGYVSIDNVKAAQEMTEYLFEKGHRKIVVVQGKKEAEVNNYRIAGIFSVFQRYGMELKHEQILTCNFRESIAYEQTKSYIQKNGKETATAFLCLSDVMALGVLRAINDMGYHAPGDFSVTGFDGIPIASYTTPSLTTIEQDMEEIGYRAAAILQELREDSNQTKSVYVPYRFVERNSVMPI